MKVLPFKIPRTNGELVLVQHDRQPHLYHTLHQHQELQILLVRESSGTAVIGGYIGEFHPGDVFLVGSNVPHVFKNEKTYYEDVSKLMADVIYIFIDEKLSDNELLNFSEISKLFQLARQGIQLKGGLLKAVASQIEELLDQSVFERQMSVVDLVYQISTSDEYKKLNGEINPKLIDETEGKRLNDVMQFTFDNFSERITLEEVASVANMVPSAFCRFFKQRTRKTYFDFLTEIRIRNACKLLLNRDLSVLEICYKSGFNNLSHFNRKFKDMTGYSPLKYCKAIKGEVVMC